MSFPILSDISRASDLCLICASTFSYDEPVILTSSSHPGAFNAAAARHCGEGFGMDVLRRGLECLPSIKSIGTPSSGIDLGSGGGEISSVPCIKNGFS